MEATLVFPLIQADVPGMSAKMTTGLCAGFGGEVVVCHPRLADRREEPGVGSDPQGP